MIPFARPVALLLLAASLLAAPAAFAQGVVIERAPENPPQDAEALRTENRRLTRELDSTRHAVERLTADLADARLRNEATYDEGQRSLATLRTENQRLADELEVKRLTVERLTANLDATQAAKLETATAEQQTAAQAAQAEFDALRQKLADAEAELAQRATALQTAEAELTAVRERLTAATTANTRASETASRLEAATATATQLQSEKTALETQLAEARANAASLREQLAASSSAGDASAKLAETEAALTETRRALAAAQADNQRLQATSTDASRTSTELESLRAAKQALETQLAQAREAERALRQQHEAATADTPARIAELESKLSTVLRSYTLTQAENEKLQASATDAAQLATELQTLRAEKTDLEARLAQTPPDLSAKVAELEDRLSTTLRSYSLLQTENDRLKTEAAQTAEAAHTAAAKSAGESAAQISALFDELRQTKAQVSVLARENAELKTRAALAGPPPGTTLSSPSRPGAQPAFTAPTPPAAAPETAPAPRTHVVVLGDTLGKISRQYYGTPNRWEEILRANPDVVPNANALRVGVTLRIP